MLVLRIIRQTRWDVADSLDWLPEGDIPADALADFANTTENRLSVWFLDETKNNLLQVVAALAAVRDKVDKLDYVLFPEEHLIELGIKVADTKGDTPDEQANQFHRNLIELSANKLVNLTKMVFQKHVELNRVAKEEIVRLISDAVRSGWIPSERMNRKLREVLTSHLAAD